MTRSLPEEPKPFKQPIVDSHRRSLGSTATIRACNGGKWESGRRGSLSCRLASRALSNLEHAQWTKWLNPPPPPRPAALLHLLPPRCPPRLRSNFAVKFERMPCKSRNRGQFRGNVNKYRCTLVSRATFPGYGLMVNPAQSPRSVNHPPATPPLSPSTQPEINMKLVCNPDSLHTVDARKWSSGTWRCVPGPLV